MATRAARTPATLSAFVLHHYDWSESSLILDLFTREQGRLAVVAKGAKRPYSQLRSVLLPFQRLQVSLGKPPKANDHGEAVSEVQTLRGAEWAGGGAMLTGAALFSGFYLNELLMKLLARGDPHAELFDLYAQSLPALAAQENDAQAALRAFEMALLKATGLLPDLSLVTLTQEVVQADARYALQAEAGVVAARVADTAMSGQVLIGLQAALEHGSLAALQQACTPSLPELKAVLRGLLHYHLGSPVLRTRQVMLDVQALERSSP
jgi:DNA repair protein RecO (recombination protein O)